MSAPDAEWILIAQAAATLFMTGLIWFVQIVHYPLMERVGPAEFTRYHGAHTRRTSWVVGPPMLVEAATATMLAIRPPPGVPGWQVWTGLALVAAIWISTAAQQVPQHRRLAAGFEPTAHRRLVASNGVRVVAWTLRSVLVLSWLS